MDRAADRFPRVERLDAEEMAQALFEQTRIRLAVEGPCAGGQVGAAYVRWPDGHIGVLKWRPHILRFGIHPDRADREVIERLDTLLDALPEAILRPAWAHMSLRMTDWAIRHFPPGEVGQWLDLAGQRLG